ncbi:MAG: hypothetical protein IT443_03230 [Phycisphaeraceae bacterium]|nr:hypothetical protein [Phycisphaeraceae bacterium]
MAMVLFSAGGAAGGGGENRWAWLLFYVSSSLLRKRGGALMERGGRSTWGLCRISTLVVAATACDFPLAKQAPDAVGAALAVSGCVRP